MCPFPHILAHSPGPFLPKSSCLSCPQAAALQQSANLSVSLNLTTGEAHLLGRGWEQGPSEDFLGACPRWGMGQYCFFSPPPFPPLSGGLGSKKEPGPKEYREQESEVWVADGKGQGSRAPPSTSSLLVVALGSLGPSTERALAWRVKCF